MGRARGRGRRIARPVVTLTIAATMVGAFTSGVAAAYPAAGPQTQFSTPTAGSQPEGLTAGPDGNIWFAEASAGKVGRITPAGTTTEFPLPTAGSSPDGVASGPDGNIWVAESTGNKIASVTTSGSATEFALPTANSSPNSIVSGPGFKLWFTEEGSDKIGSLTTFGALQEWTVPTASAQPGAITVGPDGNLWFTEGGSNKIGRMTPAGVFAEFAIPHGTAPDGITTVGGNVWFDEIDLSFSGNDWVGRVTPTGTITEYPVAVTFNGEGGISAGPDGYVWFAMRGNDQIGRLNPSTGTVQRYTVINGNPSNPTQKPYGVTVGPDNNIWYTLALGNAVGYLTAQVTVYNHVLRRNPVDPTLGSDGNVWVTEPNAQLVTKVSPSGGFVDYAAGVNPTSIAAGADGNLWFTDPGNNTIGRITTAGTVSAYPIPSGGSPVDITAGPDGNLWFTEYNGSIGKITPSGVLTEYAESISVDDPLGGIAAGPDGFIWYTDTISCEAIEVDTNGGVQNAYYDAEHGACPYQITAGPDGNMWWTDGGSFIGSIQPSGNETSWPASLIDIVAGPDGYLWGTGADGKSLQRVTTTGSDDNYYLSYLSAFGLSGITLGASGKVWFAATQGLSLSSLSGLSHPATTEVVDGPTGFLPSATAVPLGQTTHWTFTGPTQGGLKDLSGMGLFPTVTQNFVSYRAISFTSAGNYHYADPVSGRQGTIVIPVGGPGTAAVGTPFTLTWATAPPGAGFVSDVELETPGATAWSAWQTGVTSLSAPYTAPATGTYRFRARLRNASGRSGWSTPVSVSVH